MGSGLSATPLYGKKMIIETKYSLALTFIIFFNYILVLNAQSEIKGGQIFGTIDEYPTNQPVPYTNISLLNNEDSLVNGTVSDFEGNYKINKIPFGKYSLEITQLGYLDQKISDVEIRNGENLRIDISLKDYSYQYEETAKQEIANGDVEIWLGGLINNPSKIPDSLANSIHKKYGFRLVLIGCDPTGEDKHNAIIKEYLDKRNGENWEEKMNAELEVLENFYRCN